MITRLAISACYGLGLAVSVEAASIKCPDEQKLVATTAVIAQSPGRYRQALQRQIPKDTHPELLIVGDSIALGWNKYQSQEFAGMRVHNFGVGGEQTQELLWRLQNFAPADAAPSAIILIIGTNNLANRDFSSCGILLGISAVIEEVQRRWHDSRLYVLPLMPRGKDFRFRESERRVINSALRSSFEGHAVVQVVPINEAELTCATTAGDCPNFQTDRLHLTAEGYRLIRKALGDAGLDSQVFERAMR